MNRNQCIAQNFSNAAEHYDSFAEIQRGAVDQLKRWLSANPSLPILDAGAGTGYAMEAGWVGLDMAFGMCQHLSPAICADMAQLPFRDHAFEAVFSSLAIQWLDDPTEFFQESARVTKKKGSLYLATLGTGTLKALRHAFEEIGQKPPLLDFLESEALHNYLNATNWNIINNKNIKYDTQHKNITALMRHLKGLGARYAEPSHHKMRGKGWLQALEKAYPKTKDALRAEWDIILIHATK
jgi:malonyl-CoA O-methyltransferase